MTPLYVNANTKIGMVICILLMCTGSLFAQKSSYRMEVKPEKPVLNVGETVQLTVTIYDSDGKEVTGEPLRFFSRRAQAVSVSKTGLIEAHEGGTASILILRPDPEGRHTRADIEVKVNFPEPTEIQFVSLPDFMFVGTSLAVNTVVLDAAKNQREDLPVQLASNRSAVASLDAFDNLTAHKKGKITLSAKVEGIKNDHEIEVRENPVVSLELNTPTPEARTGDVVAFQVIARDKDGKPVKDVPVGFAFQGKADNPSYTAAGMIEQDGRFVAYEPGRYTVTASCGQVSMSKFLNIIERDVQRKVEFVGRGTVNRVHTSDLWVWEGQDGKDYAVTGTWGADGEAYFWDVTDPANLVPTDTFRVDARTVNDVKVSEDGRICVLSREGGI